MKKQMLMIWMVVVIVLLSVGSIVAQDDKKMEMADMKNSPHHLVMMAYRHNMLTFSKALRDMTKDGKLEAVDLARNVFIEITHSMEKMAEVHQSHMSKMKPEMMAMMKLMMDKMEAENMLIKEHILALEKALQTTPPDALEVNKHAAALVSQLEKMEMPDKKMKM